MNNKTVLVTGSSGLVGSESVMFFCRKGFDVIGIDNDMRKYFFGTGASTRWKNESLLSNFSNFKHFDCDIRNQSAINEIFKEYNSSIDLIIHTAAQPSHDWAAKEPITDFTINATGTLILLEAMRTYSPGSTFIFTSTNKVYGDRPNTLHYEENESRFELGPSHHYYSGIDESMSIDNTLHSIFGASKVSADVLVQEYGKYFELKTGIFRGGCLTGPNHSGAELHGFLSYLMKCAIEKLPYTIFGYNGKQVRDNIHSEDLIQAFYQFYKDPRKGEVYNIGGGRESNCSMREAINKCEIITGNKMNISYEKQNRIGDHKWWISNTQKFKTAFPDWSITKNVDDILQDIYNNHND